MSTVKFYQRAGLIPEGQRRHANQVDYGLEHVQRVRLIRALLETGGLSIAVTNTVLGVLDDQDAPMTETFQAAQGALAGGDPTNGVGAPSQEARGRILDLAADRGWCVSQENPGINVAARAVDALLTIDANPSSGYLDGYADAAEAAARADVEALATITERDRVAELMVVGTVMGDPLFAGLRRLAQQNATQGSLFTLSTPTETEQ